MKMDRFGGSPAVSWAWALALALVTVAGTLAAACMMPFVALAVICAATLPRSKAFIAVGTAWGVEQALGFGLLGYPADAHAVGWGLALGAATIAVVQVSRLARADRSIVEASLAFAAGFATYELVLYIYGAAIGGADAFTVPIVLAIGRTELTWFAALLVIRESLRMLLPPRLVASASAA